MIGVLISATIGHRYRRSFATSRSAMDASLRAKSPVVALSADVGSPPTAGDSVEDLPGSHEPSDARRPLVRRTH